MFWPNLHGRALKKHRDGIGDLLGCKISLTNGFHKGAEEYNVKLFLLAIVMWALWTSRNKRAMEGKFPRLPSDLLFKTNFFLQKWRVLLKATDQDKLQELVSQVKGWVEAFLEKTQIRLPEEDFM